jgi:hypothetical protein
MELPVMCGKYLDQVLLQHLLMKRKDSIQLYKMKEKSKNVTKGIAGFKMRSVCGF